MHLCLFVCLGFFIPLESSPLDTSALPMKGCKYWPMFGTHDHWARICNVPHLLWHGPTLCNGHLRGPVTLTHVAERMALRLSLSVSSPTVDRTLLSRVIMTFKHLIWAMTTLGQSWQTVVPLADSWRWVQNVGPTLGQHRNEREWLTWLRWHMQGLFG